MREVWKLLLVTLIACTRSAETNEGGLYKPQIGKACGNYSRVETIQGQHPYKEIRYVVSMSVCMDSHPILLVKLLHSLLVHHNTVHLLRVLLVFPS